MRRGDASRLKTRPPLRAVSDTGTVAKDDDRKPNKALSNHIERTEAAIQAIIDHKLTAPQSSLLLVIAHKDGNGCGCFLSSAKLAASAGIGNRATFYDAMEVLTARGLVASTSAGPSKPTIRRFITHWQKEIDDTDMVRNRTSGGTKSDQQLVRNRTTNKTLTRHERTSPVGLVGSCVEPGSRVLTFDRALRLGAHPVEDVEEMSGPLIAAPTSETPVSMRDNPKAKAWDAWIEAEKPKTEGAEAKLALWAFAVFVWHEMKMKPTRGNLSRAWSKHDWTMHQEDRLTIVAGKVAEKRHLPPNVA